ncbi:hypothetical protein DFS34DRAFT_629998 [Phlyctochytrium arcticum]|nr:hypothetical protein DFS34DRAFT_629998 [Phlyctochytrium arcticum]
MRPASIKSFCTKDVAKCLATKVPVGFTVVSVHIIGLAVGIQMEECATIKANWQASAEELGKKLSIPCSGDLWSFDDIIAPSRTSNVDESPFPLTDADSLRQAWSSVDRQEDASYAVSTLQGGGSVLVRGYAGVGKTTIFKEIVTPAMEGRGPVHYVDGYALNPHPLKK